MIINFYSLKDADIGNFAPPFMAYDDHEAMQLVRDAIEDGSALHKFPTHYHLIRVGSFDSDLGHLHSEVDFICSVNDLLYRLNKSAEVSKEEGVHE